MKQGKRTTVCAGIDVSKKRLDVAVHGLEDFIQLANAVDGFGELLGWLRARGVSRVGLEASGGYERAVAARLLSAGFEVVIHQPIEVRLFARLRRLRAKNDKIDARLIAAATAALEAVKAANDPDLAELAERFTAYEQAVKLLQMTKNFREHATLRDLKAQYQAEIRHQAARKKRLERDLIQRIKANPVLAARFKLLLSVPGIGPVNAAVLVVRMPELGSLERGQAAALIGVAPYDHDSGQHKGKRFTWGGRARPRRFLYMAALAAKRKSGFAETAQRLLKAGKPKKVAIVAVMRKLIEAANLVLRRRSPWIAVPNG